MRAVIRNRNDLFRFAESVDAKLDGKPYTITVKRFHRPRTLEQNAKLHAMINELADHCGYTASEMKDIVKAEFAKEVERRIANRSIRIPQPTSEMTVMDMSEMIERLYQLGAEVGCQFTEVA